MRLGVHSDEDDLGGEGRISVSSLQLAPNSCNVDGALLKSQAGLAVQFGELEASS